jgi:hypothetical protein
MAKPTWRAGWQAIPAGSWAVRLGAIGVTVALLALVAPLIWAAAAAGVGLVVLLAMAAAGSVVFQALPLAMQALENRWLRWRKAEAGANPIEQLQNECMRREERLAAFRRALVAIGGQIETMAHMIEERASADPGHVLDRQTRALRRMAQFHACNVRRLDAAKEALDAFRHQVKQKVFEWEFAQSGQVVLAALNPGELDELMQDLITDEALVAVQQRFNAVFAELDIDMRAIDAPSRSLLDERGLERLDALTLPRAAQRRMPS